MTGSVGSPLIHPRPGYTTHARHPPIFKTAHNHTFRNRVKFTGNWHKTINTRVKSCRTSFLMSYSPNHQNIFPGCTVDIKQQLSLQEKTSSSKQSGDCKGVDVYVQMVGRWENSRYSEDSSCPRCRVPGQLVNFTVVHAKLPEELPFLQKTGEHNSCPCCKK